jgi:hypothetical protein
VSNWAKRDASKRTVVSEGAVGGDVDILLLAVRNEVVLRQQRVRLDLVRNGHDTGGRDDPFEVGDGEVGHADIFDLVALSKKCSKYE